MPSAFLTAVADTDVNSSYPDRNNGGDDNLAALSPPSRDTAHALILFDLSSIPKGSTIHNALLQVKKRGGGYGNVTVECRKVTSGWGEYSTTWNNRPSLSGVYASVLSPDPFDEESFEFHIEAIVQEWVNNQSPNFGFGLTAVNGNRIVAARNAPYPPRLFIDYTPDTTPPTCTGGTSSPRYLNIAPNGTFRVEVTGVSDNWSGVQKVQFATWTETNGQDDIRWYDGVHAGNGTWYYDVPLANHGNAEGKYNCHVYAWDFAGNSANIRVIDTYVDRTPPNVGSVSGPHYTNQAGGTFRVWAYNVLDGSSGVNRVQFPTCHTSNTSVWKWYNGVKDGGSNNWYCDIPMGDFGNAEGTYFSDVYAYDNAGNQAPSVRIVTYVDRTPPNVSSVQGYSFSNQTSGARRVWIYGVNDPVSGVNNIDVWYQQPGQQWIQYGNAVASGSDYYADIPVAPEGEYTIRFYPYDRAGNTKTGGYETKFFVDRQRANDPNASVTYGETAGTITWLRFSDPAPSSGYERTELIFGEWTGSAWVGGFPNRHMGVVTTDINVLEKHFSNLKPGARYRYTAKHFDKAGNESAYTWREFVTKKQIGQIQLDDGATLTFPIYDPESGVLGSKALRIAIAAGIGCFELFGADVSLNPFRVQTAKGIMTIQ